MQQAYIISGSLKDERTVTLDEALPIATGKVRVVVEMLPAAEKPGYDEVMAQIREGQRQRGQVAPTRELVDAYLKAERASWDD